MDLLMTEYEKLIQAGYQQTEIEQLLFLYGYTIKTNCLNTYIQFLAQIKHNFNYKQIEQLIKCITHNTPYQLLLHAQYSVFVMNEVRRFLEDTLQEKGIQTKEEQQYYELGEKMLQYKWNEDMIYQFRRFVKGKKIASIKILNMISELLFQYKIKDWIFLNIIYENFLKKNLEEFENWLLYDFSNSLKNYIQLKNTTQKNKFKIELFVSLFR